MGPGPQPGDSDSYYQDYRPGRVDGDVIGGAIGTAGSIATAPFRAPGGDDAYAMAPDNSYCAQRYRSYDPASGTFMGRDGRRYPSFDFPHRSKFARLSRSVNQLSASEH
jgi:hypothetical protein